MLIRSDPFSLARCFFVITGVPDYRCVFTRNSINYAIPVTSDYNFARECIFAFLFERYRAIFTIGTSILLAAAADVSSVRVFNERARGRVKLHIPPGQSRSPGDR